MWGKSHGDHKSGPILGELAHTHAYPIPPQKKTGNKMRNWALLALLSISLAFAFVSGSQDITRRDVLSSRALNSTKGTTEVQWDSYSLLLRGQRIFLQYV